MPRATTPTASSLGTLASTGATSTPIDVMDDLRRSGSSAVVVIVATSVTSGATLVVERQPTPSAAWEAIGTLSITANGSYGVSTAADGKRGDSSRSVRVRVARRTDGSYACSLTKLVAA